MITRIPLARVLPAILRLALFVVTLAPGLQGFSDQAQDKSDVAVQLTASKVLLEKGKEQLTPAAQAKPGDLIQYEAVYRNSGTQLVKGLVATVPIPAGLTYQNESARPAKAQASLDGKTFAAIPLRREVTNPDRTKSVADVPLSEYRALRWTVSSLAPGASVTVGARAHVVSNAPATAQ